MCLNFFPSHLTIFIASCLFLPVQQSALFLQQVFLRRQLPVLDFQSRGRVREPLQLLAVIIIIDLLITFFFTRIFSCATKYMYLL
jgi:hypothetical protein